MSAPAVTKGVAGLQAAFAVARPLAQAPPLVFAGVRDAARDLVATIDVAVLEADAAINDFTLPAPIPAMPAALRALLAQCAEDSALCDLRGLIGRVRTNINLAQV